MKILIPAHIFSNVVPNGLMVATWNTVNALAEQGVKVYVVSNRTELKGLAKKDLHPNIKLYTILSCHRNLTFDKSCIIWNWFFSFWLCLFARIDFIYSIDSASAAFFAKLKYRPVATRVLRILSYQDPKIGKDLSYDRARKREEENLSLKPSFGRRIADFFSYRLFRLLKLELYPKNVDIFFYMSNDSLTDSFRQKNQASKIVYLPNVSDVERFKGAYPQKLIDGKKGKTVYLFVGKIGKRKGVEYLVEAFNNLNKKYNDTELWLIGAGAPDTIEWLKTKIKTENIKILGKIFRDEVTDYYKACDVFVLPSLDEAFSNAVVEAMAAGKPVITTRIGATLDYFEEGKMGYLIDSANSDQLYTAMESLYQKRSLINEMGIYNKEYAKKNFSSKKLAEIIIGAFKSLKKG